MPEATDAAAPRPYSARGGMEEHHLIVRKIFGQAAARIGSRARLAGELGISYEDAGRYMAGQALPPQEVLARVAALLGADLARIRAAFSSDTWRALKLP